MRREKCIYKRMNLVIDIGNTRAKLFVFDGKRIVEQVFCDSDTLQAIDQLLLKYTFEQGIMSSVGRIGKEAEQRLNSLPFGITRLSNSTKLPIELQYKPLGSEVCSPMPPTMGADRIAALIGGISLHPDSPLLIVDAGTCVTYEVINDEGVYRGGNIAPGLTMRLNAMHEHTALLPLVCTEGETPDLGFDTETAMRSGATLGLQYEIEGYIEYWKQRYPGLRAVITGGNALTFNKKYEHLIERENNLVAIGLNAIILPKNTENISNNNEK